MRHDKIAAKVSIVIPCYNKEFAISKTFDSVLDQSYDSIEVVLVDDGSTDSTSEIITQYIDKFEARGYDVITFIQENCGLPAAVQKGLSLATGEFVCQLDADDCYEPEFVSETVGILLQNPKCHWVAVDSTIVTKDNSLLYKTFPLDVSDATIENWVFQYIRRAIYVYMFRFNQIYSNKIIENYYIEGGNQDQQILYPLFLNCRGAYMERPLHITNKCYDNETHHSRREKANDLFEYYDGLRRAGIHTINALNVDNRQKSEYRDLLNWNFAREFCFDCFHYSQVETEKFRHFYNERKERIKQVCMPEYKTKGKVIAWGALGVMGRYLLPFLEDTCFQPDVLWDASAGGHDAVFKPNPKGLNVDDLVLVLPMKPIEGAIVDELEKAGHRNYLTYSMLEKEIWKMCRRKD